MLTVPPAHTVLADAGTLGGMPVPSADPRAVPPRTPPDLRLGLAAVAGGVWSVAVLNALWVAIGLGVLPRGALRRRSRTASPAGAADHRPGEGAGAEGALRERRRTA